MATPNKGDDLSIGFIKEMGWWLTFLLSGHGVIKAEHKDLIYVTALAFIAY